jgi:hypothetical protein
MLCGPESSAYSLDMSWTVRVRFRAGAVLLIGKSLEVAVAVALEYFYMSLFLYFCCVLSS